MKNQKNEEKSRFYGDNILTLLIKFYRKFISPYKRPCCRFTPSCSLYALQALREWGVIFGISLTVWRILRCNPFSKGGHDPVPENPFKRGKS